ncbi:hypothetical protein [Saccharopolyspora taberi]|uniref:Uncharacterized protein n=1 Tax=Saccharopolyspora taberi TaxID=60895 RepID=A0ABN3VKZ5_9PSEU
MAHLSQQDTYYILLDSLHHGSSWFDYSEWRNVTEKGDVTGEWSVKITESDNLDRSATVGHNEILAAMEKIERGGTSLADRYVRQARDVLTAESHADAEDELCQLDADSFDCIVQVAVLGDVVYG